MKYLGKMDTTPESPTYKQIIALGRIDMQEGVLERYDPALGWVHYSPLIAATGIGGDTSWGRITQEEAEGFIKRKRKDWDDPPDTKAGWSEGQKDALGTANDLVAESHEGPFRNAAARVFEAELRDLLAIMARAKKAALQRKATVQWERVVEDVKEYLEAAGDLWRSTFVPLFRAVIKDQGERWAAVLGLEFDVDTLLAQQWFDEYTLIFAQPINLTTKRSIATMLQQAMDEGWSIPKMQKHLTTMFEQWITGELTPEEFQWYTDRLPPHRTEMIARTETIRASNAGSLAQFITWGVKEKEWLATGDDRTRTIANDEWGHLEASGQVVPVWDTFTIKGPAGEEELYFPGDPAGSPSNTIQCRCTVLPVFPSEKGSAESGHWGHRGRPGQRGGSLPGGAYLALPKHQRRAVRVALTDLNQAIVDHRVAGYMKGIEYAIALDKDGNRLPAGSEIYQGENGLIIGSDGSIPKAAMPEDRSQIEIFIHTHPLASSFSDGDIALAMKDKTPHYVAMTNEGSLYALSLTEKTSGHWSNAMSKWWSEAEHARDPSARYYPETTERYQRDVAHTSHQATLRVAAAYGLEYAWEDEKYEGSGRYVP